MPKEGINRQLILFIFAFKILALLELFKVNYDDE